LFEQIKQRLKHIVLINLHRQKSWNYELPFLRGEIFIGFSFVWVYLCCSIECLGLLNWVQDRSLGSVFDSISLDVQLNGEGKSVRRNYR